MRWKNCSAGTYIGHRSPSKYSRHPSLKNLFFKSFRITSTIVSDLESFEKLLLDSSISGFLTSLFFYNSIYVGYKRSQRTTERELLTCIVRLHISYLTTIIPNCLQHQVTSLPSQRCRKLELSCGTRRYTILYLTCLSTFSHDTRYMFPLVICRLHKV